MYVYVKCCGNCTLFSMCSTGSCECVYLHSRVFWYMQIQLGFLFLHLPKLLLGQKMPVFFLLIVIHVILRKFSIVNWQSLHFRRLAF